MLKILKNIWNLPGQPVELTEKLATWTKAPPTAQKRKFSIKGFFSKCELIRGKLWILSLILMIFYYFHYCWVLWSYWRDLMLRNAKSYSCLKLAVNIQRAFHPCDPFYKNYFTSNSAEKHCFAVLKEKLYVKYMHTQKGL